MIYNYLQVFLVLNNYNGVVERCAPSEAMPTK